MSKSSREIIELSLFPDEEKNLEVSPNRYRQINNCDFSALFQRLEQSKFRSRFRLKTADLEYIAAKGLDTIRRHAADFVAHRLAPASIPNDGKQTPMRGHPVFVAQHATGCCCRGCFSKWHHIPARRALTAEEQVYAVAVLMAWIERELDRARQKGK